MQLFTICIKLSVYLKKKKNSTYAIKNSNHDIPIQQIPKWNEIVHQFW